MAGVLRRFSTIRPLKRCYCSLRRDVDNVDLQPITRLMLEDKIERIVCQKSFLGGLFLDMFDKRILTYPDLLETEHEVTHIKQLQENIINSFVTSISSSKDPARLLKNAGYLNLSSMSMSEQCLIFESIGSSCLGRSKPLFKQEVDDPSLSLDYNLLICHLILQNCLVKPTIDTSPNEAVKERLKGKNVAYAYTEKHSSVGVISTDDWSATAIRKDDNTWAVSGGKSFILDVDYDEYLVFCKTLDYEAAREYPQGYQKPHAIVCFAIPKDRVTVEKFVEGGVPYQKITFPDLLLARDEHEILEPKEGDVAVLNTRSRGHLAVSAYLSGRLKTLFNQCVDITRDNEHLHKDQISQHHMLKFGRNIFGLESSVFLVSGMMDAFLERDFSFEGLALKILASSAAHDSLYRIPAIISGVEGVRVGKIDDSFALMDGFLEGSVFNSIFLALLGLKELGPHLNDHVHKTNLKPFYPSYFITERIEAFKKRKRNQHKLSTYLIPDFQQSAGKLEDCVQTFAATAENVLIAHGKNVVSQQIQLMCLGKSCARLLEMTACLGRASRAQLKSLENQDADTFLVMEVVREAEEIVNRNLQYIADYLHLESLDNLKESISKRNMKYGGYFAYSPLDKVHY